MNRGLGFSAFATAQRTIQGYEAMHMLRKGQLEGVELMHMLKKQQLMVEVGDEGLTAAEQFYALAA